MGNADGNLEELSDNVENESEMKEILTVKQNI